ncbi:hypothetical protein CEUSTIGMA_g1545.t1, partial [Chlamydomonas eustigma]
NPGQGGNATQSNEPSSNPGQGGNATQSNDPSANPGQGGNATQSNEPSSNPGQGGNTAQSNEPSSDPGQGGNATQSNEPSSNPGQGGNATKSNEPSSNPGQGRNATQSNEPSSNPGQGGNATQSNEPSSNPGQGGNATQSNEPSSNSGHGSNATQSIETYSQTEIPSASQLQEKEAATLDHLNYTGEKKDSQHEAKAVHDLIRGEAVNPSVSSAMHSMDTTEVQKVDRERGHRGPGDDGDKKAEGFSIASGTAPSSVNITVSSQSDANREGTQSGKQASIMDDVVGGPELEEVEGRLSASDIGWGIVGILVLLLLAWCCISDSGFLVRALTLPDHLKTKRVTRIGRYAGNQ